MDAFGATVLVVVAFKLPIVDRVDARKICLLIFGSLKASEMAYHDNVKYFISRHFYHRTLKTLRDQELCVAAHTFAEEIRY